MYMSPENQTSEDHESTTDMLAPDDTKETVSVRDRAEEFTELTDSQLTGSLNMLSVGFNDIADFDPANPAHMDLRNRMLAAQQLAGERGLLDVPSNNSEDKKDDPDTAPRLAQRVDGGTDVVDAEGSVIQSVSKSDDPAPLKSFDQTSIDMQRRRQEY